MSQVLNLSKGQVLNLAKEVANLNELRMGLGWTGKGGRTIDLDSYAILHMSDGTTGIVYFGNHTNSKIRANGIVHHGDDLTGGGRATDPNEIIDVVVPKLPAAIKEIEIGVSIWSGASSLDEVKDAFINIVDRTSGRELCRYNIADDFGKYSSVMAGKMTKVEGGFDFKALGEGSRARMSDIIDSHQKAQNILSNVSGGQDAPAPKKGFFGRLFG